LNATPGFGADPEVYNDRMKEANNRITNMNLVHSESSHNSDDDKELEFGYFKSKQHKKIDSLIVPKNDELMGDLAFNKARSGDDDSFSGGIGGEIFVRS